MILIINYQIIWIHTSIFHIVDSNRAINIALINLYSSLRLQPVQYNDINFFLVASLLISYLAMSCLHCNEYWSAALEHIFPRPMDGNSFTSPQKEYGIQRLHSKPIFRKYCCLRRPVDDVEEFFGWKIWGKTPLAQWQNLSNRRFLDSFPITIFRMISLKVAQWYL